MIVTWILSSCSCLSDSRPLRRWGCWGWGGRCRWRWWRWARWSRRRGCPRPGRSSSHCAGRLEQAWLRWGRGGGQSWGSCYRGHPSSLRTTWPDNIDHQSLLHSVVLLFSVQISWCYLLKKNHSFFECILKKKEINDHREEGFFLISALYDLT